MTDYPPDDGASPAVRVVPIAGDEFPSSATPNGVAVGWFGEDGQWGVAYGHIDVELFARAVDEYEQRKDGEGVDRGQVLQVWAVIEVDRSLPEDHELHQVIRWYGVTEETDGAFPVTAVDTTR